MKSERAPGILDARTDEQWLRAVNNFTEREDWDELWKLAQKAPPIWTVRIVKFLGKKNWVPAVDEQPQFFRNLFNFAASCNEFDLPGPDIPVATSRQVNTSSGRIAAARVTADGELLFVIDEKATALDIYGVSDLTCVERIRLDMINGKQFAVLGFAIDPTGSLLAVLVFEPKSQQANIHIYELEDGEVKSDRWINWSNPNLGKQIPRLCIDGNGSLLTILSAFNMITVWDIRSGKQTRQFENGPSTVRYDRMDFEYPLQPGSNVADWCKFGRRAIADMSARSLVMSYSGGKILASRGREVIVWGEADVSSRNLVSSSGLIAVSPEGHFAATLDVGDVMLYELNGGTPKGIAVCADPLACLAISEDSELLALGIVHSDCVKLWHLPDGRNLGTLFGLAHDALVEFRFTSGGSVVAVTRSGLVQVWEADGNGNAWPWSQELVQITHQPVDHSSVQVLRQAQEMRRRGWLSVQECNLLDLALALMQHRLNLDIEVEWDSELPGDKYDIEIADE